MIARPPGLEKRHRSGPSQAIIRADSRIAIAPGLGFAQMGAQRDPELAADWPDELHAIYLIEVAKGRGLGRALMAAVARDRPFTALMLGGNARAARFYAGSGATCIATRNFAEDGFTGTELVYAWTPPFRF